MITLGIAAIIAGLAVLAMWAGHRLLRNPGQRAAPRGDALAPLPPWEPPLAPVKRVDGAPPWDADVAAAGPSPQHRFSAAEWRAAADDIEALINVVRERHPGKPRPSRPAHATDAQTTGEIFEHLHEGDDCWCKPWKPAPPPAPPAPVVEGLNGHYTVDAAVESMFTRAQAEQVRALENGEVHQ